MPTDPNHFPFVLIFTLLRLGYEDRSGRRFSEPGWTEQDGTGKFLQHGTEHQAKRKSGIVECITRATRQSHLDMWSEPVVSVTRAGTREAEYEMRWCQVHRVQTKKRKRDEHYPAVTCLPLVYLFHMSRS